MSTPAVWTNAFLSVDGTDISTSVRALALDVEVDPGEVTVMGVGTHINISGLLNWAVEFEVVQETSILSDLLDPVTGGTSARAIIIREDQGAVSVTNQQYAGNATITAYRPYGGEVGSVVTAAVSMVPAGALVSSTT